MTHVPVVSPIRQLSPDLLLSDDCWHKETSKKTGLHNMHRTPKQPQRCIVVTMDSTPKNRGLASRQEEEDPTRTPSSSSAMYPSSPPRASVLTTEKLLQRGAPWAPIKKQPSPATSSVTSPQPADVGSAHLGQGEVPMVAATTAVHWPTQIDNGEEEIRPRRLF